MSSHTPGVTQDVFYLGGELSMECPECSGFLHDYHALASVGDPSDTYKSVLACDGCEKKFAVEVLGRVTWNPLSFGTVTPVETCHE